MKYFLLNRILRIYSFLFSYQLIILNQFCYGQTFSPLPPGFDSEVRVVYYDSSSSKLYAGGIFKTLFQSNDTVNGIAMWDGVKWDSLGTGINVGSLIKSIQSFNGEIVVGGYFNSIGGISAKGLAVWNGNAWYSIGDAPESQGYGCVLCIYPYNNDLYVGGCFDSINGIPAKGIAKYDGISWQTFPSFGGSFHYINDIKFYNGELYVAGNFNVGNGMNDIMKFDGFNWTSVGGGLSGTNSHINSMQIFNNELFVGGYFQTINGDPGNNIAQWNGTSWSQPINGITGANVFTLDVFQNKLFVAGLISNASGVIVSNIAIWDGSTWAGLNNFVFDNGINSLYSDGTTLYIGGAFNYINNFAFHRIAKYDLLTSTSEISHEQFSISPNPANDFIQFKIEGMYAIEIFDICGNLIFQKEEFHTFNKLDITSFSKGIYLLKVSLEKGVKNVKLIKL